MQLKNDGFDWIRKKKKLRTFYEMILQGKKISINKKDKIIKLLDDIDTLCQEGWDDDQRGNFYTIMNITEEIKKELT